MMALPELDHRALRILTVLLDRTAADLPPTMREVQTATDIDSPNALLIQLWRLREHGLVTWEIGKARTLRATCQVERRQ